VRDEYFEKKKKTNHRDARLIRCKCPLATFTFSYIKSAYICQCGKTIISRQYTQQIKRDY
jgi:hypothetical protein